MRSATVEELATLAKPEREVTIRVKVQNGSGTMIDLTRWVDSCSIDHDVDQPVGGATVSFVRSQGETQSLAPLREDSTLNRLNDGVTYSPILDLNRAITIETLTTDIGGTGTYKMMFEGTIDIVDWASDPVTVSCRDGMAPLVDRWIEDPAFFGTTPVGTDLEDVMDDISDAVFGAGIEPVYTPVSPAYDVIRYQQQEMSVSDSWTDLIQLRGMDIREKWHDGTSAFRHTLYEPDRTKTVPDYTFTPNKYITVSQLSLELTNIRNVVQVSYRNSAALGNRAKVTVSDSASITKYGRRFFRMQESDTSPIDTSSEATTMANAALADLKDPKAEQEVEMPYFWPAELGDLYRYTDNRVHYNTNQDWAVVEIKHVFAYRKHRTILKVRGSVAGQYATWLGRGGSMGGPVNGTTGQAFAPYPFIVPLNTEGSDATWDLRFNAINGSGGGGANIEYTIKSKETFGTETTLVGPASGAGLPDDVTITRDPKNDQVITFTVTDAATGMFAVDKFTVPAFVPAITGAGNVNADLVITGSTHRAVPLAELPVGTQTKTLIISSAAFIAQTNALGYNSNGTGISPVPGPASFFAFAPLPQGVTITELEMWSQNPTAGGASSISLTLLRQNAAAFAGASVIVTVSRSAVAGDGGGVDSSGAISEAVTTNTYVLQLALVDSLDVFQNAIITYTMPSYDKAL